jgi:DedD protein
MGGNGKRGGGDRVLESRHLVGLFLGVVLLCGVFFTLGYVMGHSQDGGLVHASDSIVRTPPVAIAPKPKQPEPQPAPPPAEWDFYKKPENARIEPPVKTPAASTAPADASSKPASVTTGAAPAPATKMISTPVVKAPARFEPPRMLKGAIVLQLAALRQESDALAMADAVQQKKFPSFVVTPTTDALYRVQVGPYPTDQAAEAAKAALERAGFKAILKR